MWILIVIAVLAGWLVLTAIVLGCFHVIARAEEQQHDITEAEAEALTRPQGNVYVLDKDAPA